MSRLEYIQAFGLALMIVSLAWLLGPWFLLANGALLLVAPELLARRKAVSSDVPVPHA